MVAISEWEQALDLTKTGRVYGVDLIDYQRSEAQGLLLHNGAGAMMAAMDTLPWLRWAWDLTGFGTRVPPREQDFEFAEIVGRVCVPVVALFVFYTDDPAPAARLLERIPDEKLVVHSNRDMTRGLAVQGWEALTRACAIDVWDRQLR